MKNFKNKIKLLKIGLPILFFVTLSQVKAQIKPTVKPVVKNLSGSIVKLPLPKKVILKTVPVTTKTPIAFVASPLKSTDGTVVADTVSLKMPFGSKVINVKEYNRQINEFEKAANANGYKLKDITDKTEPIRKVDKKTSLSKTESDLLKNSLSGKGAALSATAIKEKAKLNGFIKGTNIRPLMMKEMSKKNIDAFKSKYPFKMVPASSGFLKTALDAKLGLFTGNFGTAGTGAAKIVTETWDNPIVSFNNTDDLFSVRYGTTLTSYGKAEPINKTIETITSDDIKSTNSEFKVADVTSFLFRIYDNRFTLFEKNTTYRAFSSSTKKHKKDVTFKILGVELTDIAEHDEYTGDDVENVDIPEDITHDQHLMSLGFDANVIGLPVSFEFGIGFRLNWHRVFTSNFSRGGISVTTIENPSVTLYPYGALSFTIAGLDLASVEPRFELDLVNATFTTSASSALLFENQFHLVANAYSGGHFNFLDGSIKIKTYYWSLDFTCTGRCFGVCCNGFFSWKKHKLPDIIVWDFDPVAQADVTFYDGTDEKYFDHW